MAAVMDDPRITGSNARAALTAALGRQLTAEATLEQSSEAVKQARAAVAAVESHLSQFSDLDKRIASARAEMVKRGDSGELPDGLIADREARRAAREKLDECNSALALLESQLDAAEKARREALAAHSAAALQVMLDEAAELSDELRTAHKLVWHLSDTLYALDLVVCAQASPLPPAAAGALRMRLGQLLGPLSMQRQELPPAAPNNPLRLQGERWQAVYSKLKWDPKAQVRTIWNE